MTKEEFLKDVANWSNHRMLLWPSLEITKGLVVEFGAGDGSTAFLRQYCSDTNREFQSYENHAEWAAKCGSTFVKDWNSLQRIPNIDVLFIDHAPGEQRWVDIQEYANSAKIIVIHDSEPAATGYMLNKIWHLFKYRKDYETEGAWATAVSNFIDVSKFEF